MVALIGLTLQSLDIAKNSLLGLVLPERFWTDRLQRLRGGYEPGDHLWRDGVGPEPGLAAENVAGGAASLSRRALKQGRAPATFGHILIAAADGHVDPER